MVTDANRLDARCWEHVVRLFGEVFLGQHCGRDEDLTDARKGFAINGVQ
jgi:hypothetical protein